MFTDGGTTGCNNRVPSGRQGGPEHRVLTEKRYGLGHKVAQGHTIFILRVFLLGFVSSIPVGAAGSNIICAHANSSSSTGSSLCGVAQFYPLLPSPCHPDSTSVTYDYGEARPGTEGPSLYFSLGEELMSPEDLLPANLKGSFSVSTHFNRASDKGTLLELMTDSVEISLELLNSVLQVSIGTDVQLSSSTQSPNSNWSHVVVTIENTTQASLNISLYIDGNQEGSMVESANTSFPTRLLSAMMGRNFSGYLQDVGIYSPALSKRDLEPETDVFVSQCLCYPNNISDTNASICTGSTTKSRYDVTARAVEFLFDNSTETYWQSEAELTPVTVQLQLADVTNISKIFISFQSSLPPSATLEYRDSHDAWVALQYWADNCSSIFPQQNDGSPSTLTEAVCTTYDSNSNTLEFLIAAGGRLANTSREDVFESDQLRLVMKGFDDDGDSFYAIRDFKVCSTFCTDTNPTCTCTQSTTPLPAQPTLSTSEPTTTLPSAITTSSVSQFLITTSMTPTLANELGSSMAVTVDATATPEYSSTIIDEVQTIITPTPLHSSSDAVTTTVVPSTTSAMLTQSSSSTDDVMQILTSTPYPTSVMSTQLSSSADIELPIPTSTPSPTSSSTDDVMQILTSTPYPTSVMSTQLSSSADIDLPIPTSTPSPTSSLTNDVMQILTSTPYSTSVMSTQLSSSADIDLPIPTSTPSPTSSSTNDVMQILTSTPYPTSVMSTQLSSSADIDLPIPTSTPSPTSSSTNDVMQILTSTPYPTSVMSTQLSSSADIDLPIPTSTPSPTSSSTNDVMQILTSTPYSTSVMSTQLSSSADIDLPIPTSTPSPTSSSTNDVMQILTSTPYSTSVMSTQLSSSADIDLPIPTSTPSPTSSSTDDVMQILTSTPYSTSVMSTQLSSSADIDLPIPTSTPSPTSSSTNDVMQILTSTPYSTSVMSTQLSSSADIDLPIPTSTPSPTSSSTNDVMQILTSTPYSTSVMSTQLSSSADIDLPIPTSTPSPTSSSTNDVMQILTSTPYPTSVMSTQLSSSADIDLPIPTSTPSPTSSSTDDVMQILTSTPYPTSVMSTQLSSSADIDLPIPTSTPSPTSSSTNDVMQILTSTPYSTSVMSTQLSSSADIELPIPTSTPSPTSAIPTQTSTLTSTVTSFSSAAAISSTTLEMSTSSLQAVSTSVVAPSPTRVSSTEAVSQSTFIPEITSSSPLFVSSVVTSMVPDQSSRLVSTPRIAESTFQTSLIIDNTDAVNTPTVMASSSSDSDSVSITPVLSSVPTTQQSGSSAAVTSSQTVVPSTESSSDIASSSPTSPTATSGMGVTQIQPSLTSSNSDQTTSIVTATGGSLLLTGVGITSTATTVLASSTMLAIMATSTSATSTMTLETPILLPSSMTASSFSQSSSSAQLTATLSSSDIIDITSQASSVISPTVTTPTEMSSSVGTTGPVSSLPNIVLSSSLGILTTVSSIQVTPTESSDSISQTSTLAIEPTITSASSLPSFMSSSSLGIRMTASSIQVTPTESSDSISQTSTLAIEATITSSIVPTATVSSVPSTSSLSPVQTMFTSTPIEPTSTSSSTILVNSPSVSFSSSVEVRSTSALTAVASSMSTDSFSSSVLIEVTSTISAFTSSVFSSTSIEQTRVFSSTILATSTVASPVPSTSFEVQVTSMPTAVTSTMSVDTFSSTIEATPTISALTSSLLPTSSSVQIPTETPSPTLTDSSTTAEISSFSVVETLSATPSVSLDTQTSSLSLDTQTSSLGLDTQTSSLGLDTQTSSFTPDTSTVLVESQSFTPTVSTLTPSSVLPSSTVFGATSTMMESSTTATPTPAITIASETVFFPTSSVLTASDSSAVTVSMSPSVDVVTTSPMLTQSLSESFVATTSPLPSTESITATAVFTTEVSGFSSSIPTTPSSFVSTVEDTPSATVSSSIPTPTPFSTTTSIPSLSPTTTPSTVSLFPTTDIFLSASSTISPSTTLFESSPSVSVTPQPTTESVSFVASSTETVFQPFISSVLTVSPAASVSSIETVSSFPTMLSMLTPTATFASTLLVTETTVFLTSSSVFIVESTPTPTVVTVSSSSPALQNTSSFFVPPSTSTLTTQQSSTLFPTSSMPTLSMTMFTPTPTLTTFITATLSSFISTPSLMFPEPSSSLVPVSINTSTPITPAVTPTLTLTTTSLTPTVANFTASFSSFSVFSTTEIMPSSNSAILLPETSTLTTIVSFTPTTFIVTPTTSIILLPETSTLATSFITPSTIVMKPTPSTSLFPETSTVVTSFINTTLVISPTSSTILFPETSTPVTSLISTSLVITLSSSTILLPETSTPVTSPPTLVVTPTILLSETSTFPTTVVITPSSSAILLPETSTLVTSTFSPTTLVVTPTSSTISLSETSTFPTTVVITPSSSAILLPETSTLVTSTFSPTTLVVTPTSSTILLSETSTFPTTVVIPPSSSAILLPETSTLVTSTFSPTTLVVTPTSSTILLSETSTFPTTVVITPSSSAILLPETSTLVTSTFSPTTLVVTPSTFPTTVVIIPSSSAILLPETSTLVTSTFSPTTLVVTPTSSTILLSETSTLEIPSIIVITPTPTISLFPETSTPVTSLISPTLAITPSSSTILLPETSTPVTSPSPTTLVMTTISSTILLPETSTLVTSLTSLPTVVMTPEPSTSFFPEPSTPVTSMMLTTTLIVTPTTSTLFFTETSTPVTSLISPTTIAATPTPSTILLPQTSTPLVVAPTSSTILLTETSTPVTPVSPTNSTILIPETSTPVTFMVEPTSTQILPSVIVTTLIPTSTVFTQMTTTIVSTPMPTVTTISPSATPSVLPTPIPQLPPFAPLVVNVNGLGIPLQAQPLSRNGSDGLQYELDVGAFIGITGDEALTESSVIVGLGEFSGTSEEFQYQPETLGMVDLDMVFSSDEVWSDRPNITLALQARDSQLLSTRILGGKVVSVNVSHPLDNNSITSDCYLNNSVSGVCVTSISLDDHMSWFTDEDVMVDVTARLRGSFVTEQVTLRAKVAEHTSSNIIMMLPAHSVFPGDIVNISIHARYNYLLSSYSFNCSVGEHASILGFTGSSNWSLIQTFPTNSEQHVFASVTGFRNYDTDYVDQTGFSPDHLASVLVKIGTVPDVLDISVSCEAVDLLLTTMETPHVNIFANATDRMSLRIGKGELFVQPITAVKLFAHTSINRVINIAVLTQTTQTLNLTIQAFYTDGTLGLITEDLECWSEDGSIIEAESTCGDVFFNGSGTSNNSGETNVILQHNGSANGSIPFRVWLPSNTAIEVGNDTLRKIRTSCSDSNPLYQKTHVHVVTRLISMGETSIDSVYITSAMLPYLETSNDTVLMIDGTTGEIEGISAGQAEITISGSSVSSREVLVSDANAISVQYVDVFIFSEIQVNLINDTATPTTFEILLLQEFSYINSKVNVVSVAVFEDGQRQVLDRDMVIISDLSNGTLVKITESKYSVAEEVGRVAFDISWSDDCIIADGHGTVEFNSSIPQSLVVRVNSSTIANITDPATAVGIPSVVKLEVLLIYENGRTEDVTMNPNTRIEREDFISIEDGNIEVQDNINETTTISAEFGGFEGNNNLRNQTILSVVRGDSLSASVHPYPRFNGSRNVSVDTIRKLGSSFQMVEIVVQINLSDGSEYDITDYDDGLSIVCQDNSEWLRGNVLALPNDTASTDITINVIFMSLTHNLELGVEAETQLKISSFRDITFTNDGSVLNTYLVEFGVTFVGDIYHSNIPTTEYPTLFEFYTDSATDAINISAVNETGFIQVLSNFHESIRICVSSRKNQSVYLCEDFSANLQPGSGEIDLGDSIGLPLMSVDVDCNFVVPVYLNLNYAPVGSFEMEVTFSSDIVQFVDITQGGDWESGQLVYVHPASDRDRVTFGGILHAGTSGTRLHLANLDFNSMYTGQANFSANVSFIAQANVNATLLEVDRTQQVSESSRVSLQVESSMRKRDEDEYMSDEEPPLMSPTEFSGYSGVRRLRREANADCMPNCVMGDVNADCIVNLRDVYLLQLYVAESVFNFSSQNGQELLQAFNNTMLDFDGDNMFRLSDILELVIITLNLAYEVNDLSATAGYNTSIEKCVIEISGLLESLSGELPSADIDIYIIIGFLSTDPDFDGIFRNMSFTTALPVVEKSDFSNTSYHGGSVRMMIEEPAENTIFRLDGMVDSLSVGFNVTVAVIVTDLEMSVLSFSNDVNDLEEALELLDLRAIPLADKNVSILSGACERPQPVTSSFAIPSTTSVIPSSPSLSISSTVPSSMAPSSSASQTPSTSSSFLPVASLSSRITARSTTTFLQSVAVSTSPNISSSLVQSTAISTSVSSAVTTSSGVANPISSPLTQPSATGSAQPSTRAITSSLTSSQLTTPIVAQPSTRAITSSVTSSQLTTPIVAQPSTRAITSSVTSSQPTSPALTQPSTRVITSSVTSSQPTSPAVTQPSIRASISSVTSSQRATVAVTQPSTRASISSITSSQRVTAAVAPPSTRATTSSRAQPSAMANTTSASVSSSTPVDAQPPTSNSGASSSNRPQKPMPVSTTQLVMPEVSSKPVPEVSSKSVPESVASPNVAGIVSGVLSVVVIVLIITLVVCGVYIRHHRKKGLYLIDQHNGIHIRSNSMISNGSGSFWQHAENGIEMSPRHTNIDIVPLEHYGSMMETNIVANHCAIMSEDPYGSISLKHLINDNSPDRGPPKRGGPAPLGAKQLQMQSPTYADTGTIHTGATSMAGYTSSSMDKSTDYDDEEEEGQLVLPDYDASQAYLSLGLTPLSQLSPDAHTSNDFGFFPSMPPPVAPSTSSIFSPSSSTSTLTMDSPFSIHSAGHTNGGIIDSSTMPDAYPDRRSRRSKYDAAPLSQGFPLKLEPVMEQSPPVSESHYSSKQNGFSSSAESSQESPPLSREGDSFMFPSAVPTPEFSRLSQGRTALRKRPPGMKNGSREKLNATSPTKTNVQGGYGSFGFSRHVGKNVSPDHNVKSRRQGTKGVGPTVNGHGLHELTNGHNGFELMERSRKASTTSSGSCGESEESFPHKWTPRHSRHSSLDETPVGAHRSEHTDSSHLYTTYEHR